VSFASDIRNVWQQSLMSQEAFAQALGVSFTTVNRWESGKSKPNYKAMKQIDEFCKTNNIDFDISKEFMEEQQ
jgi:transcriptional regulator with XRE-family HTH domain